MLLEDGVVKKIVVEEGKWWKLVTEDLEEYNCFKASWLPEGYKKYSGDGENATLCLQEIFKILFFSAIW